MGIFAYRCDFPVTVFWQALNYRFATSTGGADRTPNPIRKMGLENTMKRILLTTAAFAVLGIASASAADLGAARPYTKAPAMAPIGNWAGFYIGAMGGYASENGGDQTKGGFGGGTVGYNWQMNNIVFGLEADAAGASISNSVTIAGVPAVTLGSKVDALGTVRGRLGFAVDQVLFYGTAGYAWTDAKLSATALGLTISDSKVLSGWTAGAGVEWMFAPHWSVKGEYLYRTLGNETFFAGTALVANPGTRNINSGQVGVNYHF
jgi:outer membrane immunogenic protein